MVVSCRTVSLCRSPYLSRVATARHGHSHFDHIRPYDQTGFGASKGEIADCDGELRESDKKARKKNFAGFGAFSIG